MTSEVNTGTRTRLLEAAARQVAAAPGEDISVRAVCDAVGVKMPTLYHFFGSKQGLIDAVTEQGFDRYLADKTSRVSSGDPIQDIRAGWDAHVAFGLANPGVYTLMYGKVRPGYLPPAQARPREALLSLTRSAAAHGRLVVSPEQAGERILATNVGVTLRQISLARPDAELSAAVREAVLASLTGTGGAGGLADDWRSAAHRVLEHAAGAPDVLGETETRLLMKWLRMLVLQPPAEEPALPGSATSTSVPEVRG